MATPVEIAVGAAVEVFFIAIATAIIYRVWGWFFAVPKRHYVQTFQVGVVVRDGRVEKVLDPGAYWVTPKRRLLLVDVRPTPFQVPAQELLTTDGMAVRISLGGEYRVTSPSSFVTESSDAFGTFFLELRSALRVAIGEINSQNFQGSLAFVPTRLKELLIPRATQLGIEMTQIEIYEAVPIGWLREA